MPAILCPVDFSEPSRGALKYAAAAAAYSGARLTVLTINDPLLVEAADMSFGRGRLTTDARTELERFFQDTIPAPPSGLSVTFVVATGRPEAEILRISATDAFDLVVMSSHGATGVRKLFFGSTTERVLRETKVPILVTPPLDPGPTAATDLRSAVRRIIVPLDLNAPVDHQMRVARATAEALDVPLLLLHIVEPVHGMVPGYVHTASIDAERRNRAELRLQSVMEPLPPSLHPEALVMFGEPAEEIAKIAHDRAAGLIVMGLHASPLLGARMGSVTYRVLCLAKTLVLALPLQP